MSGRPPADAPRILLFDGVCNVCSAWVDLILRLDPDGKIHLASLQSEIGGELLAWADRESDQSFFSSDPDAADDDDRFASMVFIENGVAHGRSTAFLRACRHLRLPWPLLTVGLLIPRPMRDWLYGEVASHRYEWFGKRHTCRVPTPEIAARFLESRD